MPSGFWDNEFIVADDEEGRQAREALHVVGEANESVIAHVQLHEVRQLDNGRGQRSEFVIVEEEDRDIREVSYCVW